MDSNFNKEGYTSTMHSFPFINDGPRLSTSSASSPAASQQQQYNSNNNTDIQVPPGVIHIKPAWKPVKLDEKPPFSYATIIAHAILSSEYRKLTLSEIYQWISKQYPCYSLQDHRWQNSIRHNLSLQKAFAKLERNTLAVGKGCYWTIVPGYEQHFIDNLVKKGCGAAGRALSANDDGDGKQQPNNNNNIHHHTTSKQFKKLIHDSTTNKRSNHSHLFTIFRMNPTTTTTSNEKEERSTKRKKTSAAASKSKALKSQHTAVLVQAVRSPPSPTTKEIGGYDSDCDSGVDLNCSSSAMSKKEMVSPYFMEYSPSANSSTTALMLPSPTLTPLTSTESAANEAYFDHSNNNFTTLLPPSSIIDNITPHNALYATETMSYWPTLTNYTTASYQQQQSLEVEFSNYFDTTMIDHPSSMLYYDSLYTSTNSSSSSLSSTSSENLFLQYPTSTAATVADTSSFFFL